MRIRGDGVPLNLIVMLRFLAHFFSIICHPIFILTYMLLLLLMINPYEFGVNSIGQNKFLILMVFSSTVFIPGAAILMMRPLGLIESLRLEDRQERIGPYIITGIFYLWIFRNLLGQTNIPVLFKSFVLGATIGLFLAFFINLFSKISMHTVGMGGLLAMTLLVMGQASSSHFWFQLPFAQFEMSLTSLLMTVILLSGIVGTARLLLRAHDPQEIYGGYLVGLLTQFIAFQILVN